MKFIEKLKVYFSFYNYEYNELVDRFINLLIDKGELIGNDCYSVWIKYDNNVYYLWDTNYYYAILSRCYIYEDETCKKIYDGLRPSRKTIIKYLEWLEKKDNYSIINGVIINSKDINNILNNK